MSQETRASLITCSVQVLYVQSKSLYAFPGTLSYLLTSRYLFPLSQSSITIHHLHLSVFLPSLSSLQLVIFLPLSSSLFYVIFSFTFTISINLSAEKYLLLQLVTSFIMHIFSIPILSLIRYLCVFLSTFELINYPLLLPTFTSVPFLISLFISSHP